VQVQPAGVPGRGLDGPGQIELIGGSLPGKLPQASQRDLEVARTKLHVAIEVAKGTLLPDLDGPALLAAFGADAHASRVVTEGSEGRGASGADPLVATLVAFFLLGKTLAQRLHDLVPAAQRLDVFFLLFSKDCPGTLHEPFLGNVPFGQ